MKNRLSKETMTFVREAYSGLAPGEYRCDHINCPAGTDTKRRLYTRVTDDGKMLLSHCFNCGASGAFKYKKYSQPSTLGVTPTGLCTPGFELMDNVYKSLDGIGRLDCEKFDALLPTKYLSDVPVTILNGADFFGVRHQWRGDYISIWIPVYGDGDQIDVYHYREYNPNPQYEPYAKWVKYYRDTNETNNLLIYDIEKSDMAVIVEDPISAMKIACCGAAGVCLGGSTISSENLFKVASLYDKVAVWLDNDNDQVRDSAERICSLLKAWGVKHDCFEGDTEPKHTPYESLKECVRSLYEGAESGILLED